MTGFPPLQLVIGAACSGKTRRAIELAGAATSGMVIVPTHNQSLFLSAQPGFPASVKSHSLQRFVERLVPAGRNGLKPSLQQVIVQELVDEHLSTEGYFGKVLGKPGLTAVLMDGIRIMKLSGVSAQTLTSLAVLAKETAPDTHRKLTEFALVYEAYVSFLNEHELLDEVDVITAAIEVLRAKPPAEAIVFDGFTRLHPLHLKLISTLASHPRCRVSVTLCADERRPLWFARPLRLLESLRQMFLCTEESLAPSAAGSTALNALRNGIGATEVQPVATCTGPPVTLINAPNQVIEVEMLARTLINVRSSLGCEWNEMAVVLRSPGPYLPLLSTTFARFGIPAALPLTEPISQNPRIALLLALLRVAMNGWQSEDVLEVLQSAYTDCSPADAITVTRYIRRNGEINGRSNWLDWAHDAFCPKGIADLLGTVDNQLMVFQQPLITAVLMRSHLKSVLASLCSPNLEGAGFGDDIVLRDEDAEAAAISTVDDLAIAWSMVGRETFTPGELCRRLATAWSVRNYVSLPQGNRVRTADPYSTREMRIRAAFVPGLAERLFPQRVVEDPLIRDDERVLLGTLSADLVLEPELDRVDEERLLFYLAATSSSDHLVLSYPRVGADRDTLPSFYLHDLRQALPPAADGAPLLVEMMRKLWDVAPRIADAVDSRDLLHAGLAAYWHPAAEQGPELEERERGRVLLEALVADDAMGETVTAVLDSRDLPPANELPSPEADATTMGHRRIYSLTELQTFATCPFQHYMRFVLKIDQRDDTNEHRMQSIMLHGALFRFYNGGGISPIDEPERLIAGLTEEINGWKPPVSRHRLPLLREYLEGLLKAFAERDRYYRERWNLRTAYVELAFGVPRGESSPDIEFGLHERPKREYHASSSSEPLVIEDMAGSGGPVHICGVIDRVDVNNRGDLGLAIDYKLNRSPDLAGLEQALDEGSSLQMPVYMLALQRVFNIEALGACYDIMRQQGRPRLFRIPNREHNLAMLPKDDNRHVRPLSRDQWSVMTEKLESTVIRLVRGIEASDITPRPGSHCSYCPYGDVCRTTQDYGYDGSTTKEAI